MRKILSLIVMVAFAASAASAQLPIDTKNVPQVVQKHMADRYSEKSLKRTQWVKIEYDYEGNYDNYRIRVDEDNNLIWDMTYLDYTALPKEVYDDFKKKYDSMYKYETAWSVTQVVNGEKMYFVVGIKGIVPYYFKYDDQYNMVEKVACAMDFKYHRYKYKPKPKPVVSPVIADTLQVVVPDSLQTIKADTINVTNTQPPTE